VLGVVPIQDGFTAIRFTPALGDLDWARGTIPTPHGPIDVSLHRRPGAQPHAKLTLPAEIEVQIDPAILQTWEIKERRRAQRERNAPC
jgi:hypothetical protein